MKSYILKSKIVAMESYIRRLSFKHMIIGKFMTHVVISGISAPFKNKTAFDMAYAFIDTGLSIWWFASMTVLRRDSD
jgi:hypothetical protein